MTGPTLIRIGAFLFVALALAVTAIEFAREPGGRAADFLRATPKNPKAETLRRCRSLGTDAATDLICLRSWAEERERFLKTYPRADRFELPPEDAP